MLCPVVMFCFADRNYRAFLMGLIAGVLALIVRISAKTLTALANYTCNKVTGLLWKHAA